MTKRIIFALLAVLGWIAPQVCLAQYVGSVSLQTVQLTLATNAACTGILQTYAVQNLGQNLHYLSVVTGPTGTMNTFSATINGIDNAGNVVPISDTLALAAASSGASGSIFGAGYFPKFQVNVTCSGNATYTISYSGIDGGTAGVSGSYLLAQIDKAIFVDLAENTSQFGEVQTPFGASGSTLYFSYSSPIANSTIEVSCYTQQFGVAAFVDAIPPTTLPNVSGLQIFHVPDIPCPKMAVSYVSGGAGAGVISIEVAFSPLGADRNLCGVGVLSSSPVSAGAAATTQIISSKPGYSIYVCGYQLSQTTTAGTLQWVYGTGTNCGTGTTNITGAIPVTANQPFNSAPVQGYVFKIPAGDALCLTTTGAGGTAAGILTYVQAP